MKTNFAKLALIAAMMVLSAACSKSEDKSNATAPAETPKRYSATAKIDGTWKGPCEPNAASNSTQRIIKIDNGVFTLDQVSFLDSACGERGMTVRTTFVAIFGAAREIPVGSNDLDIFSQKIEYVVHSELIANAWSNSQQCGNADWKKELPFDVAGKTCGAAQLPSTGFITSGVVSVDSNKLLMSEIFKGVPVENMQARVTTLQSIPYIKQ